MLHSRVSLGVPYELKLAYRRVVSHVAELVASLIFTRSGTQACLVAVWISQYQMDPDRAVADNVESNAPAFVQGTAPSDSRLATSNHDGEARQAFYQIMND
ncbi:Glutamate-1-semialdehyde 2,1-aminomutase [Gossypium arboreum]|uniref:Glutamate-1-semialdehyde 2,1-aminomutase n=1 Tax=Gossypium arboreum TaxID=29729 RepID=A0A0B0NRF8_GOSAR|nr:Glutamate-1-semialdehyde 2,1-aminomutase [Gossypium arboreum]